MNASDARAKTIPIDAELLLQRQESRIAYTFEKIEEAIKQGKYYVKITLGRMYHWHSFTKTKEAITYIELFENKGYRVSCERETADTLDDSGEYHGANLRISW